MAQIRDFKETQASIFSSLVQTTRTVGQIAGEDLAFHRSSNPPIAALLDRQASRLLKLAQGLIKVSTLGTEVAVPQLSAPDSIEDNWTDVVDVIDNLLEKADASLDEYTGVIKKLNLPENIRPGNGFASSGKILQSRNYRAQAIEKPQKLFHQIPKNDETTPFKPLLRSKPHAIVPLEESLVLNANKDGYPNPYEVEITQLKYPIPVHTKRDPIPFLPLDSVQATLVDSPEAVVTLLHELRQETEIAIDLEHHDAHSYAGLVCLMQISTRTKDWIVDTLKPWREDLQMLNEVFTDPNIVKVFHGAFMDMIWLQRDLGLYVVGLFDTFHASRCLGYPRNSLAALLKRFVNFDADKQHQMADWRTRPLPEAMFNYARSDTHFLLFIYDHLRNELLEKSDFSSPEGDLIAQVLEKSKKEALQRYERPFYDEQGGQGPGGWYSMLYRTPALFNAEQFAVFRAVHQWRDQIARTEDEGLALMMPKHVLYNIARNMPLDMPSLLGCSHPISPTVRSRSGDLLKVIKEAKAAGATGPKLEDLIQTSVPLQIDKQNETKNGSIAKPDSTMNISTIAPLQKTSHSVLPTRTHASRFWGRVLEENLLLRQKTELQMKLLGLRLMLPLPQLTAEVFEATEHVKIPNLEPSQIDPGARAEHKYSRERKAKTDDVFIIKQAGGSRKRKAAEMQEHPAPILETQLPPEPVPDEGRNDLEDGNVLLGDVQESIVRQNQAEQDAPLIVPKKSKSQHKQERKREAQRVNVTSLDAKGDEIEAFDYANAPSVLHGQAKQKKHTQADPTKAFDPYSKSLNAPKGMRKSNKETAGKSLTFKK